MNIPVEQIPLWAWILSALFAGGAAKWIFDRKKDDWKEVREGLKSLTHSVNELINIQTLHTHQINENTTDIKDLQAKVMGSHIVKYEKS